MSTIYSTGLGLVQEQFIRATGRADLDTSSLHDAIWFINAAQRWLDNQVGFPKAVSRFSVAMPALAFVVNFPDCRAVESVWLTDSISRTQLEKSSMNELRELYPALSVLTGAVPSTRTLADAAASSTEDRVWAPIVNSMAPAQNTPLSRTRRAISCVYCAPKSRIRMRCE